jgi:hypothetical protein
MGAAVIAEVAAYRRSRSARHQQMDGQAALIAAATLPFCRETQLLGLTTLYPRLGSLTGSAVRSMRWGGDHAA